MSLSYTYGTYSQVSTADCKSLATNKLNSGKPQLCLNREVGLAEAGKIIRFIRSKSIVVSTVQLALLQDFCNLLYQTQGRVANLLPRQHHNLVYIQELDIEA